MARNYSNIAVDTTLTAGINAAVTSCVVTSATGWPAAPFAAVIDPGLVTEEVVEVTIKVGTTFTITRGFDGTAAAIHALGAVVRHAAIAGDFTDLQAADTTNASAISTHIALTTTAHGGIVAGTDPRLTDARTPLAHAATHASIGSDPVTLTQGQITNLTADLGLKAPLASPTFTGIPAAPTAAPGTNTTQLATTAFVLANGGSGTVTSVALTVPGVLFSVAGSPVTTSGTLALSLLTQTANTVLAGPASGGAVAPTMRALVIADIPLITPSKGGTGVANADANTLTLGAATTISGGGTLALAGFTLTAPASLTIAGLGISNLFTVRQDIRASGSGIAAGLYVPWITGDALPTLRLGSGAVGNNQIGLYVESRTGRAIYAETTSGASAINASNGGGIGVDAIGTTGVKANGATGIGLYALVSSGQAVYAEATGTGVPLYGIRNGALTNSAGSLLKLEMGASGTPLANFGATIDIFLKSSTTATQQAAQSAVTWADPTHATRKARQIDYVYDTAAREYLRGEADGTNPMIGFLGAAATARVAVTGSRAGNAALASLLTELASKGLITDSTSA